MCRRVQCKTCGKAGWAGCGAHVDQVLAGVPQSERCTCEADRAAARATVRATATATNTPAARPSLLRRLLGR